MNHEALWDQIDSSPALEIDTEVISGPLHLAISGKASRPRALAMEVRGSAAEWWRVPLRCPRLGKLVPLLQQRQSVPWSGRRRSGLRLRVAPLDEIGCTDVRQVRRPSCWTSRSAAKPPWSPTRNAEDQLIPSLPTAAQDEKLLQYPETELRRCSKCILPETMPFIEFDAAGVCNFCHNYQTRITPTRGGTLRSC